MGRQRRIPADRRGKGRKELPADLREGVNTDLPDGQREGDVREEELPAYGDLRDPRIKRMYKRLG